MFNSFGEFLQRIMESGLEAIGLYYGVYRAKVINNADPDNLGRVILHCEQVHGKDYPEVWAWPETPYAGNGFGFWAIPDKDDYVYVRFDHGRPDKPIWHGGWWGEDDVTDDDMTTKKVVLVVKEGMKIVLDRESQTVLIEQSLGNSVFISDETMELKHAGKILVDGEDVTVQSMGITEVRAQGTCLVEAMDEVTITSAGTMKIDGADSVDIGSTSAVNIHSAGMLDIQSEGPISMKSLVSVAIQAPAISMTGPVTIMGAVSSTGTFTLTGNYSQTGNFSLTGNGNVTGDFYATLNSAHHTHPLNIPAGLAMAGDP